MAQSLITSRNLFLLLVITVLCIYFYNVVQFSFTLRDKAYQESISDYKNDIARLNEKLVEYQKREKSRESIHKDEKNNKQDTNFANHGASGSNEDPHGSGKVSKHTISLYIVTNSMPFDFSNQIPSIPTIPVLIMACNREDYLRETLQRLFEYPNYSDGFPVIVSQGCDDENVEELLHNDYGSSVVALKHYKTPGTEPYFAIAQHYGWALRQVFTNMNYEAAIILEDDMLVSVDFFNYFASLYPILKSDPTLYCISSWNDNGMTYAVKDPTAVRRTDVFPGLGWMMTKSLWKEIADMWPDRFWDEFMRDPKVRKDRSCLFPEISRNKNIGVQGTSQSQFWKLISQNKFNEEFINFSELDLRYLYYDNYNEMLLQEIQEAQLVLSYEVSKFTNQKLRVNYDSIESFKSIAKFYNIMDDEKLNMPRTSFNGVLVFYVDDNKVYLTPSL